MTSLRRVVSVLLVAGLGAGCKDPPPDRAPPRVDPPRPGPTPAPRRSAADSMVAMPIPSPVLAADAHPDYPTPLAAGTDKLFFIEDPDRGPKAPIAFEVPSRRTLRWTVHAHCALDTADVACSGAPPADALWSWRVGRVGKQITVAERVRGKLVEETHVYLRGPDHTPTQRITLDGDGRVQSAVLFRGGGVFSARKRNGGNALDGCGLMAFQLDARGRTVELGCRQWLGEPMRDIRGVATTRFARDGRGLVIEERRFGLDGRPVAATDGVHQVKFEFDPVGRIAIERYFDAAGEAVATTAGCHGIRRERDRRGALIREICVDARGAPAAVASGTSIERFHNDARGCRTGVRYLGTDGRAVTNHVHVHGLDFEVDARCRVTSEACLDIVEQPIACGPEQAARQVDLRDAHGRVIASRHYAASGAPATDGVYAAFELRYQWDELDNRIGRACYDVAGEPIECADTGYHAEKRTFDDAGRELDARYLGTDGGPASNLGTAFHRRRYDNYDHVFEIRDYDADGKLVETMGSATRRDLYDAAHRRFGILMLDAADQLARYTACYAGATCPAGTDWHAVRIVRRPDGSAAENTFFDRAGHLIETMDCTVTRCFD